MSTKIYDGIFISGPLEAALPTIQRVCSQWVDLLTQRQAEFLARVATRELDRRRLVDLATELDLKELVAPKDAEGWSAYSYAQNQMLERQAEIRKTQRRDPAVDFELELTLWYVKQVKGYAGRVTGEGNGKPRDMLLATGVAKDFGYWNNVDPDENATEAQWRHREYVWDLVCRQGPNAPRPFTFRVEPDIARPRHLDQNAPSVTERVSGFAESWTHARLAQLHPDAWGAGAVDANEVWSRYRKFRDQLRDETSQAAAIHKELTAKMLAVLPPTYPSSAYLKRG